jgi:hypothetical protein
VTVAELISAGELFEENAQLHEAASALIVPKKGKLWEERADGTLVGKVAIIRPCVSRGKKIRKLPPIYSPRMLSEHAAVFTGWPMYVDHLMEQAVEELTERLEEAGQDELLEYLQERARSVKELGGRIEKSYWDPDVTFEDDGDYGYQPGAVVGEYVPQPKIREMLEADPKILNVSINAWPTGARPGAAPWDTSAKGMMIEGIRKVPMGSVDFVFKGGAGGRPLLRESDDLQERAVSLLEAAYSSGHSSADPDEDTEDMAVKKLSEMKPEELREHLEEHAPHLVEALAPKEDDKKPEKKPESKPKKDDKDETVSPDDVKEMIEEGNAALLEKMKDEFGPEKLEEQVDERLQERDEQRSLQEVAFTALEEAGRNGLPSDWVGELKKNYTLYPSGPAAGLLVEAEKDDDDKEVPAADVLKKRVKEDVAHAVKLIQAGGGPVIEGLGGSTPDEGGSGEGDDKTPAKPKDSAFRNFARRHGMLGEKAEEEEEKLSEILTGGGGH